MSQLLYGLRRLGYKLSLEGEADAAIITQALMDSKSVETCLPNNVYYAIKRLWVDPKVLETYERRSEYHLIDCAE